MASQTMDAPMARTCNQCAHCGIPLNAAGRRQTHKNRRYLCKATPPDVTIAQTLSKMRAVLGIHYPVCVTDQILIGPTWRLKGEEPISEVCYVYPHADASACQQFQRYTPTKKEPVRSDT